MDIFRLTALPSHGSGLRNASAQAGDARVTAATPIDPELLQAGKSSSAIYHPSTPGEPQIQVYAKIVSTDLEDQQVGESLRLLTFGIGQPSANLRRAYDSAVSALSPELLAKDWGFSISSGRLVFTQGNDELSQQELGALDDAFSGSDVRIAASALASMVVKALELERGWGSDEQSRGVGQYDVTEANFGDIVDLREYLLSHGPGGTMKQGAKNPHDYDKMYTVTGGLALMNQISARAEARYAGDNIPRVAI
jgi:hypothetical protein